MKTPGPSLPNPAGAARLDLRSRVTVFVLTVGAATYEACLANLEEQDCTFALDIVDRVAPISAASQCMIDRCRTPFFVQVDEDMLLRPWAVQTLYRRINETTPDVAEVVGALYDVHLQRAIEGVKIFRHDTLRHYPFEDRPGCDGHQARRLLADGHRIARIRTEGLTSASRDVLGWHGTGYTAAAIYERYLTLQLKYRQGLNGQWFGAYPHRFLDRFLEEPSESNFFALMGVVTAQLLGADTLWAEKDYRGYDALPGRRELAEYWRRVADERQRPRPDGRKAAASTMR
jgi:hypothetical protein